MPNVYLAGPDVFYPDAKERYDHLKALCSAHGLTGVAPIDGTLDLTNIPKGEMGRRIYRANISLIIFCSGVLANMLPFRGPSMDVGTAFEMGYGAALGKPVVGYTPNSLEYRQRVVEDGLLIEDFEMVDNLMVHACTNMRIYADPAKAIEELARLLGA